MWQYKNELKEITNGKNKYGEFVKVVIISKAGSEGLDFKNIRQVHILEPYWNEVRIEQVIGRALRFCQHQDLPLEERKVDIFRYKMVRLNNKPTADVKIEGIARKKNNLLLSFIDAVKEAAIDCELFKAHNMMGSKYTCFQFNEESLFEKPIGCAYQSKLENDQKIDNGLNAKDSNILHIRVRKIKGVLLINDHTYSSENYYWFNDNTGIIYDYEEKDAKVGEVEREARTILEVRLTDAKTSEILLAVTLDGTANDFVNDNDVKALKDFSYRYYSHTLPKTHGNPRSSTVKERKSGNALPWMAGGLGFIVLITILAGG